MSSVPLPPDEPAAPVERSDRGPRHAGQDAQRPLPANPGFFAARVLAKEKNWSAAAERLEKLRDGLRRAQFKLPDLAYMVELELGNCYSGQAMYDRMLESFDQAVQTDPTSTEARFGYAVALYRTLNLPKALDQFLALYRTLGPQAFAGSLPPQRALRVVDAPPGEPARRSARLEASRAVAGGFRASGHADAVEIGLKRADLRLVQRRPEEALRIVFQLQKEHAGDLRVRRAVANLTATQDPEKAFALLGGRSSTEDSVEMRLTRANVVRRLGAARGGPLLRSLETDLGKFSPEERLRLWQGLSEAYLCLQDPPQTRRFWQRVLAQRPEDRQLRLMAYDTALEAGDEAWIKEIIDDFARLTGPAGGMAIRPGRLSDLVRGPAAGRPATAGDGLQPDETRGAAAPQLVQALPIGRQDRGHGKSLGRRHSGNSGGPPKSRLCRSGNGGSTPGCCSSAAATTRPASRPCN